MISVLIKVYTSIERSQRLCCFEGKISHASLKAILIWGEKRVNININLEMKNCVNKNNKKISKIDLNWLLSLGKTENNVIVMEVFGERPNMSPIENCNITCIQTPSILSIKQMQRVKETLLLINS